MTNSFLEALHQWQSFYTLVGSSAATLIGLLFLTVALGVRMITDETLPKVRIFVTPTLVHFGKVLVIALLFMVPTQTPQTLAVELVVVGVGGICYSLILLPRLLNHHRETKVDSTQWIWSTVFPLTSSGLIAITGFAIQGGHYRFFDALAAGCILLVITGIRNAWEATLYIARAVPE